MEPSILLIDDDPDDCQFLTETLQEAGWYYQIDCINDPLKALSFLEEINKSDALPVFIILDLNMPKISGLDLLTKIKPLLKDVPIIMYTTTCSDEIVMQAKKSGAHDCIKKGTSYADNLRFARLVLSLIGKAY